MPTLKGRMKRRKDGEGRKGRENLGEEKHMEVCVHSFGQMSECTTQTCFSKRAMSPDMPCAPSSMMSPWQESGMTHDITPNHWLSVLNAFPPWAGGSQPSVERRGKRVAWVWTFSGLGEPWKCKQWQDAFHLHSKVHGTPKKDMHFDPPHCCPHVSPSHDVTASTSLRFLR